MATYKKLEVEPCECGHIVPLDFIRYDANDCGTCVNCILSEIVYQLEKEKGKSKSLRKKIKESTILKHN